MLPNWPADRPYPSEEQIALARTRLARQEKQMRDNGYMGDWGGGLESVMALYGPVAWWHLFFEEDHPDHELFKSLGFSANVHARA
jgi:hypothetical protein